MITRLCNILFFSWLYKGNLRCKKCDFFLIFAQNKDREYTSERVHTIKVLEQNKGKKEYPFNSLFYYLIVGCKGVLITRTCNPDVLD